jgi:hypothetical protein
MRASWRGSRPAAFGSTSMVGLRRRVRPPVGDGTRSVIELSDTVSVK